MSTDTTTRNIYRYGCSVFEPFRLADGEDVLRDLIGRREYFSTKGDTFYATPGSTWTCGTRVLNEREFQAYPSDTGDLPEEWVALLASTYPTESPDYMVWSWGTLIGWHMGGGWDMELHRREGKSNWVGGVWFIPNIRYRGAVTRHQYMLIKAIHGTCPRITALP